MSIVMNASIKDMVANNAQVSFQFYRTGDLWYKTDSGFEFPVPISDCGDAVFLKQDKALLFMRYIRKHLEHIEKARAEQV
jgi:hypothetical protein